MATREYRSPVGVDLPNITGNNWHVGGILIDNPSGSWLRVEGIEQFVPPYTLGWQYPILPEQLSVTVRFVASPSGTPSANIGGPVTITLYDIPLPPLKGFASGAEELHTPTKGNITTRFDVGTLNETYQQQGIAFIIPGANIRFAPIRWRVNYNISAASSFHMRADVAVILQGVIGAVFPTAMLSPESPDSGYLPPTGYILDVGESIEIGGVVQNGGGAMHIESYLEMYIIDES